MHKALVRGPLLALKLPAQEAGAMAAVHIAVSNGTHNPVKAVYCVQIADEEVAGKPNQEQRRS